MTDSPVILDEASQKRSYKLDAPLAEFAWVPRENRLVERVAEARAVGMSYGHYMAMLHDQERSDNRCVKN